MMKGWVDRVWRYGWAYDQLTDPDQSLQRARTGVFLVPAGGRSEDVINNGYLAALESVWLKGTFGYFGFSPRRLDILYGTTGSLQRREALFEESYYTGLTLPLPLKETAKIREDELIEYTPLVRSISKPISQGLHSAGRFSLS